MVAWLGGTRTRLAYHSVAAVAGTFALAASTAEARAVVVMLKP